MVIDVPNIVLEETDAVCVHALSTLLNHVVTLHEEADSVKLGLTKPQGKQYAYMQCVDPGDAYTQGGTVVFRCGGAKKAMKRCHK